MKRLLAYLFCIFLIVPAAESQTKNKAKSSSAKTSVSSSKKTTATTKKTTASSKTKTSSKKSSGATVSNSAINGLRNEQAKIKQNIKKQEQALRANKAQVQQKLKDLMVINGEMDRRRQSIDSINRDIRSIDSNIDILNSQLNELNNQLQERKAKYVKSMRYMAKRRGIQSQLMFIFSGKDFRQIYRRMRFMREYAAYQRTQGKAVQEQQDRVNQKTTQLHQVRGQKSTLLRKGQNEQAALEGQKQEQQKVVNSLQKQQKTIQSLIDDQRKKDAALNAQIDKLVAEEVERARQRAIAEAKKKAEQEAAAKKKAEELARKKALAEAAAKENERRIAEAKAREEKAKAEARAAAAKDAAAKARAEQLAREAEAERVAAERKAAAEKERSDKEIAKAKKESDDAVKLSAADRLVSGGFEANRGRLPSPVAGGTIVSHFGQHGVEGLKGVVLDNKGINIKAGAGAAARSIYDGEVSAVFNVGGTMGVLIRHGAYISVYCNLKSVSVSRGQKVSARQTIGSLAADGILQFQLRRERDKLNPEAWLAR